MGRLNVDGKDLRQVLSMLVHRHVTDSEISDALEMPASTYSKRKENNEEFPYFFDLTRIAEHFGLQPAILYVDFGYIDASALNTELRMRYHFYRTAISALELATTDAEAFGEKTMSGRCPICDKPLSDLLDEPDTPPCPVP